MEPQVNRPHAAEFGRPGITPGPIGAAAVLGHDGLLAILVRRRWAVLACTLFCALAAALYLAFARPLYLSSAQLYLRPGTSAAADKPQVATGALASLSAGKFLATQAEILSSNPILTDAARRLPAGLFPTADDAVAYYRHELEVDPGKKNDLITVSITAPSAEQAAQMVNAVVDAYIAADAGEKQAESAALIAVLKKQRDQLALDRQALTGRLQELRQADGGASLAPDATNTVTQRVSRLTAAVTDDRLRVSAAAAAVSAAEQMMKDPAALRRWADDQKDDSNLRQLRLAAYDQELRVGRLREQYMPTHPAVLSAQATLDQLRAQIDAADRQAAEACLAASRDKLAQAQTTLDEDTKTLADQQALAGRLSANAATFASLTLELARIDKQLDLMQGRIAELLIDGSTGALDISVVDRAHADPIPARPRAQAVVPIALALGLTLGAALALFLDRSDRRLRSSSQLSEDLQVPVLAVTRFTRHIDPFIPARDTDAAYAAVFRGIQYATAHPSPRAVLLTSASPADRATSAASAAYLAATLARAGHSVLLLNTVAPVGAEITSLPDLLAGRADLRNTIRSTPVPHLDQLDTSPNPASLFDERQFAEFLVRLAHAYDHVVVHAAPAEPLSDACLWSICCDATVLVARADSTDRDDLARAVSALRQSHAPLAGALITAASRSAVRHHLYRPSGCPRRSTELSHPRSRRNRREAA